MGVTQIIVTDIVTRGGDGGDANYSHRYCHKRRGQGGMVFIVTGIVTKGGDIYSHRYGHIVHSQGN